ncbi:protein ELFN1 [Protopterus annectens]|uniref:protein ELFN1 n=1 Tax=Protopterus annectens TaxID=7888 RepID=UPI001CFA79C3|nr:protein ELFN1 [Protopterus annectens]XP_043945485.1 protein ELFN1 [Protopterus annectens]XP_043945486.1 protein ELFN1 [Protopterus annectens]XP_043945487.1 protein ELFN1 [Protopterus annectens]
MAEKSRIIPIVICFWVAFLSWLYTAGVRADCWLIEGDKGFVWLAICSQNQPPYESIPQHINSTIVDLRLNENKIKSVYYSSLSRFTNLTYLNLTKNDISYLEEGAFSAQYNLQVLQLGYNRLRNITEGILRGLTKLEELYLQFNLIETVSPNAFWECQNIRNLDLSMNRIQKIEASTFVGLSKLVTCELSSNPFYCSCELLGFLKWLAIFVNMTRTSDRMQCDAPPEYAGYSLVLSNSRTNPRIALNKLSNLCTDGTYTAPSYIHQGFSLTTMPSEALCTEEECFSGDGPTPFTSYNSPVIDQGPKPQLQIKDISNNIVRLSVTIPNHFKKMYILVEYKNNYHSDVQNLSNENQIITLKDLEEAVNYTYCVVSLQNSARYNHTCLSFKLPSKISKEVITPNQSTATHYIMTILGCLFGMVIVLGVVYYCLRKKRMQNETHKKAAMNMKKTIIELKYGPELEGTTITQLSQGPLLSGESMPRMPFLSSSAEMEQYKLPDTSETPKTTKGNYMEVRTGEQPERRDCDIGHPPDNQSSVAEISTIAKEVDKVNQIINNCIDALKSESTSFQGAKSGAVSTAEPQLVLISEQIPSKSSGFLSPVYKEGYHHPLQRHHSMETTPKRPSTSSSGSMRSPRSFRSDITGAVAYKSEAKYIEKTSPTADTILTVTPAAAILRAEAEKIRQYSEHRHSFPGSHQAEQQDSGSIRKPSILEPLTRPRPRELAYSQLSPQYHNLSYTSSPEYSCRPAQSIWERFKLHRKRHKDEEEYMAAGHALRKKVQFAKDEDLHDILDYWKGVSAQHKS